MKKPTLKIPLEPQISSPTLKLKAAALKAGYKNRTSLYGIITDKDLERSAYRRIEIMSNTSYTSKIMIYILKFFYLVIPNKTYTIWLYNKDREALNQVW